ncbi:MAG: hypothetical protein HRT53_13775 [Colwellia sp.]|nr:hypothetical protein [Colwellia sp.]
MRSVSLNHFALIVVLLINFTLFPVYAEEYKGILSVKGFGTVDIEKTVSNFQAKMMAKRAATLDAQRQLAEMIKGVQLSAGTSVEDFEVTKDIIATRVRGLLKGAFILKESVKPAENTFIAEVTLAICSTNESEICSKRDSIQLIRESVSEKN